jgi:hypothetical protein
VFVWVAGLNAESIERMEQYLEQGQEVIKWIKVNYGGELLRWQPSYEKHSYSDQHGLVLLHFFPHEYTISVILRNKQLEMLFKLMFV